MEFLKTDHQNILNEISKKYDGELIKSALGQMRFIKEDTIYHIFCSKGNPKSTDNKPLNQVKVFEVPITDYKCSVNPRGRKKYGKIDDLVFENKSKVGTKYGLLELPEIRKNKFVNSIFQFEGENIEDIVMENLENLIENEISEWEKKSKYTVLEYKEGDYFMEHSDQRSSARHFGTLLIFPPAVNSLAHTGGEFVIENGNWDVIVPTSNNKNWKFVAFPIGFKHACFEIKSGRRIVIKTELFEKYIPPFSYSDDEVPMCCDQGIQF